MRARAHAHTRTQRAQVRAGARFGTRDDRRRRWRRCGRARSGSKVQSNPTTRSIDTHARACSLDDSAAARWLAARIHHWAGAAHLAGCGASTGAPALGRQSCSSARFRPTGIFVRSGLRSLARSLADRPTDVQSDQAPADSAERHNAPANAAQRARGALLAANAPGRARRKRAQVAARQHLPAAAAAAAMAAADAPRARCQSRARTWQEQVAAPDRRTASGLGLILKLPVRASYKSGKRRRWELY